jgi:hypothetical protein
VCTSFPSSNHTFFNKMKTYTGSRISTTYLDELKLLSQLEFLSNWCNILRVLTLPFIWPFKRPQWKHRLFILQTFKTRSNTYSEMDDPRSSTVVDWSRYELLKHLSSGIRICPQILHKHCKILNSFLKKLKWNSGRSRLTCPKCPWQPSILLQQVEHNLWFVSAPRRLSSNP